MHLKAAKLHVSVQHLQMHPMMLMLTAKMICWRPSVLKSWLVYYRNHHCQQWNFLQLCSIAQWHLPALVGHVVQLHVNSHSIQVLYLICFQYDTESNVCVTLPVAHACLSKYSLKHSGSVIPSTAMQALPKSCRYSWPSGCALHSLLPA